MTCPICHNHMPMALRLAVLLTVLAVNAVAMAAGRDDLIRDEDHAGIHKKLIIAADGVALCDKPDVAPTETLKPFDVYFQLWPSESAKASKSMDQNGWIRIGRANGQEAGWIKNSPVTNPQTKKEEKPFIEWPTRFFLDPREPETPNAPKFSVDCVVNGKRETAVFSGKSGGRRSMAPILAENQENNFSVAFFCGTPPKQAGTTVAQQELSMGDLKDTSLDLVFVIDTTASMTPLIEATKDVVRQCVEALKQANPEVRSGTRFGLVAYQDATPGLKPFDIVCKLSDAGTFQQKLEQVRAATQGSEEVPEDVLAGLNAAISPEMGWHPMSLKHVMLIGDASAHVSGPKNTTNKTIDGILDGARSQSGSEATSNLASITFNAVRARNPGNNDPAEDQLCKEQFQQIAQNQGRVPGNFSDIDPNNAGDKAQCIAGMVTFYKSGLTALSGVQKNDPAAVAAIASTGDSAIARQAYVLQNAVAQTDMPAVGEGNASDRDPAGNLVAIKSIFVSKREIKRLASILSFIYDSLQQSNDSGERGDVSAVMNTLQMALAITATGEKTTQFEKGTSLKAVISELPLKSDALEITIQELAAMQDDAFKEWLGKLESTKRTSAAIIDSPDEDWINLDDAKDRSDDLVFKALRIEELP